AARGLYRRAERRIAGARARRYTQIAGGSARHHRPVRALMRLIRLTRLAPIAALVVLALPSIAAADFLVEPFFAWSRNPPQSSVDTGQWHNGGGVAAEWTFGSLIAGG